MCKTTTAFGRPFRRFNSHMFALSLAIFIIFSSGFFAACGPQKMSLKEAKQVTVDMRAEAFVAPPRRVNDILDMLNQPGQFDESITAAIKAKADVLPPDTDNVIKLAKFYQERGVNARELGRYQQQLEDLHTALQYLAKTTGIDDKSKARILFDAGVAEGVAGNFQRGIDLFQQSIKIWPGPHSYYTLAWLYYESGDFKAGDESTKAGLMLANGSMDRAIRSNNYRWLASLQINRDRLKANQLEYKGLYLEAEPLRRSYQNLMRRSFFRKEFPWVYLAHRGKLARNLAKQGRLVEAEFESREALKEALGHGGKNSGSTGEIIYRLGYILLLQGRPAEAEEVIRAGLNIMKASGLPDDCQLMGNAKKLLGMVLVANHDFVEAQKQFEEIKKDLKGNQYYYQKNIALNPAAIIALIKTGNAQQAMAPISTAYMNYNQKLGEGNYPAAQMLALKGMANAALQNTRQAIDDFSEAFPVLLKKKTGGNIDFLKKRGLEIYTESYLNLLSRIYQSHNEKQFGIDVSATSFKLIEEIKNSSIQKALGASGARTAATDPALADLVRREQDAQWQINALQETLSNALAAPPDQQNPTALQDLKASIDSLQRASIALFDEIQVRFPKYSDFTDPQPVDFAEIQKNLNAKEALIAIYPAAKHTFVWAIPKTGKEAFAVAAIGDKELKQTVSRLREALDPGPRRFGDIPDLDMEKAHGLYRQLLMPVAKGWKDAKDLLVVASGPLGTIPLSILPTAPVKLGPATDLQFGNYKDIPWLVKKASITRIPSVTALVTLRSIPLGSPDRKAFAGFGDPFFNLQQLARAEKETDTKKVLLASRGGRLHVRGIRVTEKGTLDNVKISSVNIGMLGRLPDTKEEIESIAAAMGADPVKDVFVGRQATEGKVKTMNLADRRVIVFATHALVPGDLDGLHQPAIALSAPSVTGENDDGLLTMEEVLKLKLNADWVVLSACNTGAAEGAGAEALSGLGQAFFYAGTRAMLVSMWPVETTSAKKLTTGLFQLQKENASLSRARALRKSILKLIDDPGLKDQESGMIVASYAHPLFWAPFIIVGDGGGSIR